MFPMNTAKVLTVCLLCLSTTSTDGMARTRAGAAVTTRASAPLVNILKKALKDITITKIPVYLPTWMPSAKIRALNGKAYASGSAASPEDYNLTITPYPEKNLPSFATSFYISGEKGSDKSGRKVALGSGRIGFLGDKYDNVQNIHWNIGPYLYHLGIAGADDWELIRAAKSVAKFKN